MPYINIDDLLIMLKEDGHDISSLKKRLRQKIGIGGNSYNLNSIFNKYNPNVVTSFCSTI